MPDIREQGFGLNFNKGFGSGPVITGSNGYNPQATNSAWDMQLARQGNDAALKRQGQQDALQRYLNDSGNANQLRISQEGNAQRDRANQLDASTRNAGYASAERQAQVSAQASMLPAQLQQQRFDKVFPYFTQALQGLGNGSAGYKGGGQVGSQPQIDAAPVYSEQQIQQQVNSQRAQADARAQTDVRNSQAGMAGRGFGGNSPLAMALAGAAQGRAMQAGSNAERDTRYGAAQANRDSIFKGQTAQEQQFANRQSEEIERNKAYTGSLASLLGAFGNVI